MQIISFIFGFLPYTFHYFQLWLLALAGTWYQVGLRKFGLIIGTLCLLSIGSDLKEYFAPKTEAQIEAIQNANEDRIGNALEE